MFSSPNKKNCTYNHSEVTPSQSGARRIVYLLPSYQPSCFFICFYHSRHEEGSAASCFRFSLNHVDPLTLRFISHFPKSQTLRLNTAGCHKLRVFSPSLLLCLWLLMGGSKLLLMGEWVCFCLCLCGYECFSSLYVSVISEFIRFFTMTSSLSRGLNALLLFTTSLVKQSNFETVFFVWLRKLLAETFSYMENSVSCIETPAKKHQIFS